MRGRPNEFTRAPAGRHRAKTQDASMDLFEEQFAFIDAWIAGRARQGEAAQ